MSDWRQIQARIRKAKVTTDPAGQLAALYERTRDAMVAFELARHHEKLGENHEAARWYTAAAERFRRAQWKVKAQEALTRLGVPVPAETLAVDVPAEASQDSPLAQDATFETDADAESRAVSEGMPSLESPVVEPSIPAGQAIPQSSQVAAFGKKRHRRGRRGGRGRRRGQGEAAPASSAIGGSPAASEVSEYSAPPHPAPHAEPPVDETRSVSFRPAVHEQAAEAPVESSFVPVRGRAGDPGLSSRMGLLESQLRRLLAASLFRVDQADQAPAGPGVFLLSDSEQTTYYFIEECQTLRIGIANLLRSDRSGAPRRAGGESVRARLAEHLEISEPKVAKYLKDYCAVRWLQLDEGAPRLAHFSIAVLRPLLND